MPKLYRVRYIPFETVELSSDQILFMDNSYLITSWEPIHPRNDMTGGISCVFFKEGWKINAIKGDQNKIIYWHCDIIDTEFNSTENALYMYDLLVDIVITEDRRVEIVDLDELAIAFEEGLITKEQLLLALQRSDSLLQMAYRLDVPSTVAELIGKLTHEECKVYVN